MFVVIQLMDTSIDFFEIGVSIVISGYNRYFRLKMNNRCDLFELNSSNIFMLCYLRI
jgi:hypothetical protein